MWWLFHHKSCNITANEKHTKANTKVGVTGGVLICPSPLKIDHNVHESWSVPVRTATEFCVQSFGLPQWHPKFSFFWKWLIQHRSGCINLRMTIFQFANSLKACFRCSLQRMRNVCQLKAMSFRSRAHGAGLHLSPFASIQGIMVIRSDLDSGG